MSGKEVSLIVSFAKRKKKWLRCQLLSNISVIPRIFLLQVIEVLTHQDTQPNKSPPYILAHEKANGMGTEDINRALEAWPSCPEQWGAISPVPLLEALSWTTALSHSEKACGFCV